MNFILKTGFPIYPYLSLQGAVPFMTPNKVPGKGFKSSTQARKGGTLLKI